ncbi:hypothetical protein GCM10010431_52610 [Streptomyces kunmingensis]
MIHAPRDVCFETLDDPKILHPTDAVIRTAVTCVCGSDLWPYRGLEPTQEPHPMGHEYVGFVEEVGSQVTSVKPGQFVIGSFATRERPRRTADHPRGDPPRRGALRPHRPGRPTVRTAQGTPRVPALRGAHARVT